MISLGDLEVETPRRGSGVHREDKEGVIQGES
jgi:hypothetical protein